MPYQAKYESLSWGPSERRHIDGRPVKARAALQGLKLWPPGE